MNFIELFFLAIGLSMDAFAVAVCLGLSLQKASIKKMLVVGLYFGIFQAFMPLAGFLLANIFAHAVIAYSHWIAFALLVFLGGKMIVESLKKEKQPGDKETSLSPAFMLPLALATSIDALAVGISFAFLQVNIIPAVILIGLTTLTISTAGVKTGNVFGLKFKSKAEFIGGLILVLIGFRILFGG